MKNLLLGWAMTSVLAVGSDVSAGVIIVDPDVATSQANTIWTGHAAGDREVRVSGQITAGVDIPLSWSNPNSSTHFANATFNFGNYGLFISDIDNSRTGGGIAQQHARIAFTVDTVTEFIFAGEYTNTNVADFSGRANLQNALTNRTTNAIVIPTTVINSPNFLAGPVSLVIPTVSGLLTPGNVYVWDVFIGSLASGNPAGSTGEGEIALHLNAVPEPASLSLGSLGIAGIGLLLRRRKQAC